MPDVIIITLILIAVVILVLSFLLKKQDSHNRRIPVLPEARKEILLKNVSFYKNLNEEKKLKFETRVHQFLTDIRITGIRTEINDLDKVLVAASAIIPIFAFDNWEYINLNEVLLYPETFDENFQQEGSERFISGMVGTGAMQNMMILSQKELRQGFQINNDGVNTAIHEFAHLIDKTDGYTDGLPENLIPHQYIKPWLKLMHQEISQIRTGNSDINPYGAKSEAEFFAVVSEYFFEKPGQLKEKHPELYELLEKIFQKDE